MDSAARHLSEDETPWRAGFELEVILSDLDDPRFEEDLDDAMDTASPLYRKAVAKRLTELTGREWSAPRTKRPKSGFYVLEEYDLDPLRWPYGRVAGVELLTPPLPLDEAEVVRRAIVDAIWEMDGPFNATRSETTDACAWHINIDPGTTKPIDPEKLILGADELSILAANNRQFSQYAAPQQHSYGIPLLRHLKTDPDGLLLVNTGLINLLRENAGSGKRYACNFDKLERDYVELRHFSTLTFFQNTPLRSLLAPVTRAFEMWMAEVGPPERALFRRYKALRAWLDSFRDRLSVEIGPMNTLAIGRIKIDRQKIADVMWNGSLEIRFTGGRRYSHIATIHDVPWPDVPEGLAVAALDYAELIIMGRKLPRSGSPKFQALLDELAARFCADELRMPAPDASLRKWSWTPNSEESAIGSSDV